VISRPAGPDRDRGGARRAIWVAGLTVAAGAAAATAHGLYQVATAATVPAPIGWLYPLITDGLALVAYAATARLHDRGRRYAAGIVVLAAGLSGLAQAVYLAGGLNHTGTAPAGLRFGVGAWPAVAAALTAHLLHLIGTNPAREITESATTADQRSASDPPYTVRPHNPASNPAGQPDPVVQPPPSEPRTTPPVQPAVIEPVNTPAGDQTAVDRSNPGSSARDRARAAAHRHHDTHGALPTVTELMDLAHVARGTAGTVLKDLRKQRPALHLVSTNPESSTDQ
jgi:hypothetical protein